MNNPLPVTLPEEPRSSYRHPVKRLRFWHTAIIDDMLIHPKDELEARAKRLGYSKSYLGSLMNSDMLKAAYAERRKEFEERLDDSLVLKLKGVADAALDVMKDTLETRRSNIPFDQQIEATNKVLSLLGFGPKPGAGSQVVVQNNVGGQVPAPVSAQHLANARNDLRTVEELRRATSSPPSGSQSDLSPSPPVIEAKPEASGE